MELLDLREERGLIEFDALLVDGEGDAALAEQDVVAGQLREHRFAGGAGEAGGLGLEQADGFAGLAAFEEGAGLEEQTAGELVESAGVDEVYRVRVFAGPVKGGGGREGQDLPHVAGEVLGIIEKLEAVFDDLLVSFAGLQELEIALQVVLGQGVVDGQEVQAVAEGLDRVVGAARN